MAFVECLKVSQDYRIEGPLWKTTLGACPGAWGRVTRRNLSVGCVMAMAAGKKPPASTSYLAQRRGGIKWGDVTNLMCASCNVLLLCRSVKTVLLYVTTNTTTTPYTAF